MDRIAIEVKNLTKEITGRKAIDNVSFKTYASEIVALVAPQGSGSSLLTKALTGLVKINSGEIKYFDHNLKKERDYIMNFVGFKVGEFNPWKNMTTKSYFKYSASFYQGDYLENALNLLNYFKVSRTAKLKELSKEALQIIAIIDSIFFEPEVIILDKTFNDLSDDTKSLVKSLLKNLKLKGCSILLTADNLDDVSFTDRILIMKNGQILDEKDFETINKNYKLVSLKTKRDLNYTLFNNNYKELHIDGNVANFTFLGDMNELLKLVSSLNVLDINITNPCLEDLFKVL